LGWLTFRALAHVSFCWKAGVVWLGRYFGRRIQKSGPLGTTNYLYDGKERNANPIEEVDNVGNLLARYTQGLGTDEPLATLRAGTSSYYNADGLGSITSLSNSAGTLANTYTYDAFGKLTTSTGSLTNPFQFTGRDLDAETGLRYYRARYYDPISGRFLNEDPVKFAGGINFYEYAENEPSSETDPSGLLPRNKDKWWGYNDRYFQMWWHRCYWNNEPYDGTRDEVAEAYEIWNSLGRPKNGDCGGKKKPCEQEQPETAPENTPIAAPPPLSPGETYGIGGTIILIITLILSPVFI
jgi:RHS repeat-associated protein